METITAQLNISTDKAEKKLEQLREKIAQWERELNKVRDSEQGLEKAADDAYKKYQASLEVLQNMEAVNNRLKNAGKDTKYTYLQIRDQRAEVSKLKKEFEQAEKVAAKNNDTMFKLEENIKYAKEEAGKYVKQIESANSPTAKLQKRTEEVGESVQGIIKRIKGLIKRVLVFSVIAKGLRLIRDYFEDVVLVNDEATEAIGKLKGALLTMVQPVSSVIVPVLTKLINFLTKVVYAVATFVATLGGKSLSQISANAEALYEETDALNATGTAAKKASKQLASFDELNVLSDNDSTSSGSSSTTISPIFDISGIEDSPIIEALRKFAEKILEYTQPAIEKIKESIVKLKEAWGSLQENPAFQKMMDFFTSCIGIVADEVLEIIASGLTLIADALNLISDALKGNWLDAMTDLLQMDLDIVELLLSPFRKLQELIAKLEIPDWLKAVMGIMNSSWATPAPIKFLQQFRDLLNRIKSLLNGDSTLKQILFGGGSFTTGIFGKITASSALGLASGTVVPPNKEFLAMLGDNKQETEVVSPLSTMKQAFLEAMQEGNFGSSDVKVYIGGEQVSSIISRQQRNTARALGR